MATLGSPVVLPSIEGESKKHYLHKWVLYLSIPQVLFGVLCVIFQSVLVDKKTVIHFVGQGFWAGVLFIAAGVLGIVTSKRKTTGPIIAFLGLSVIAAVGSLALLVPSALEWNYYNSQRHYSHNFYRRSETRALGDIAIPLDTMMVFIAVIQGILAILCSAFACHGLCCREKKHNIVVIPMGQQGAPLQPTGAIAGAITMPTVGFNVQPTQPPVYEPPTMTPPDYKMQETHDEQHM